MMTDPAIFDDGMECPKCGCHDLRAWYTRRESKRVRRVRICRACGVRVQTFESIDRELPTPPRKPSSNTGQAQQNLPFD